MTEEADKKEIRRLDGPIAAMGQVVQEKSIGLAFIGLAVMIFAGFPEWAAAFYATGVVASALVYLICLLAIGRIGKSRVGALLGTRSWFDRTVLIQFIATPIALGAAKMLAIWNLCRAWQGEMPGDVGSLLVLTLTIAMAAKLAAETYLFSWLGTSSDDPSGEAHIRSAQLLSGDYAKLTMARFTLGILGGIIMPLGSQILASGAKNIPATVMSTPSVILAVGSLVCLVPGEILSRWLYYRVTR